MVYTQLSSLGIPGGIVLGTALENERRLVMYTPCIAWINGLFEYNSIIQIIDPNRPIFLAVILRSYKYTVHSI